MSRSVFRYIYLNTERFMPYRLNAFLLASIHPFSGLYIYLSREWVYAGTLWPLPRALQLRRQKFARFSTDLV